MIKLKASIALLFSTLLLATSCSQQPQTDQQDTPTKVANDTVNTIPVAISDDDVLETGVAAGKIKIDQDSEEVFKMLGTPDSSDAAMQKVVAFWFEQQDGKRYATAIFAARDTEDPAVSRVRQIRVTSPTFKTPEGLGVGSTLANIKKAVQVQEIKYPLSPTQDLHIWSDGKGMAFEVADNQICNAVIIYKKGDEPGSTYLPLR